MVKNLSELIGKKERNETIMTEISKVACGSATGSITGTPFEKTIQAYYKDKIAEKTEKGAGTTNENELIELEEESITAVAGAAVSNEKSVSFEDLENEIISFFNENVPDSDKAADIDDVEAYLHKRGSSAGGGVAIFSFLRELSEKLSTYNTLKNAADKDTITLEEMKDEVISSFRKVLSEEGISDKSLTTTTDIDVIREWAQEQSMVKALKCCIIDIEGPAMSELYDKLNAYDLLETVL